MAQVQKSATAHQQYHSVGEFYPFYLSQHASRINRRLHFIGTLCVIALVVLAVVAQNYWLLLVLPFAGYGFAWVGHFGFEKNKPATFEYPFYSLACDFVMFRDMLIGRIKF
ncbi:MAG: Mpo1-like protein [Sulfurifustis sp.]